MTNAQSKRARIAKQKRLEVLLRAREAMCESKLRSKGKGVLT